MLSTTPSAAIIDLDGTLVHTLGDFVLALQHTLRDLPQPYCDFAIDSAMVEPLVGKGSEHLIKSVLALVGCAPEAIKTIANVPIQEVPPGLFALAYARYQHHYGLVNGKQAQVYDGVVRGLEGMAALGWPLACVTNKPTRYAQELLVRLGLNGFFAFTLGGDAVNRKKPDPLPLWVACRQLGVQPSRVVMIGDSSNDAQAARAAGCPVWLVSYGYNHGAPVRSVDADGVVDSLADLPWLAKS